MKQLMLAIAALNALAACAASANPVETPPSAGLSCEVRFTPTRDGLRIEAVAEAGYAARGEYQLVVRKSGRNGSSDIVQGGPFALSANGEATLSASEFNLERGDRYDAELELYDADRIACSDKRILEV
jgi:hypothetical protein